MERRKSLEIAGESKGGKEVPSSLQSGRSGGLKARDAGRRIIKRGPLVVYATLLLGGIVLGLSLSRISALSTGRLLWIGDSVDRRPSVSEGATIEREFVHLPGTRTMYYSPKIPLVRYFHPPKTGSGFFNVLFYTLCTGFNVTESSPWLMGDETAWNNGKRVWKNLFEFRKQYPPEKHCRGTMSSPAEGDTPAFEGWAGMFSHEPVSPNDTLYHGTIAGLFRDPTERAVSAFHHNRHLFGGKSTKKERYELNLAQWVRFHGVAGCQTKMLLGYKCGEDYKASAADIEAALDMIQNKFLFVGITEYFDATVELWHKSVVGGPVYDFETKNTRLRRKGGSTAKHDVTAINQGYPGENWNDTADEIIYAEALRLFRKRCAEYQVSLGDEE